jgi:hypothetical protein
MILVSFYFICLHILFEKENANLRILHQELISPHLMRRVTSRFIVMYLVITGSTGSCAFLESKSGG